MGKACLVVAVSLVMLASVGAFSSQKVQKTQKIQKIQQNTATENPLRSSLRSVGTLDVNHCVVWGSGIDPSKIHHRWDPHSFHVAARDSQDAPVDVPGLFAVLAVRASHDPTPRDRHIGCDRDPTERPGTPGVFSCSYFPQHPEPYHLYVRYLKSPDSPWSSGKEITGSPFLVTVL